MTKDVVFLNVLSQRLGHLISEGGRLVNTYSV